jgi:hypothetical protein
MPTAVIVFVYALAVARVTRLIVADRITEAPRQWLAIRLWAPKISADEARDRLPAMVEHNGLRAAQSYLAWERVMNRAEPPLPVYLLTCPWCASIYVAAIAAPLAYWWGTEPWLLVPALALAFSYATGWLSKSEG